MRFNKWCYEWLERYKKRFLKDSTYETYSHACKRIYCRKKLDKLTIDDIQNNINKLIDEGFSHSSIKNTLTIMEQATRRANLLGYCSMIDFSLLELPNAKAKKVRSLTLAEQRKMLQHLDYSFYGQAFAFLLCSGLRVGELIALEWSDIDFKKGIIHIERTDYRGKIQTPKTDKSKRDIPISKEMYYILQQNFSVGSKKCFRNTVGEAIAYRSMLTSWHRFCENLGLPPWGLHVLRHTYATNALTAGVNIKVLSELLGHKSMTITLNIYCDVREDEKQKAAERLSDFLFSSAKIENTTNL